MSPGGNLPKRFGGRWRAALDLGYGTIVAASACATRDLPDGQDGVAVGAGTLHRVELAALADRFAVIVPDSAALTAVS